MSQSDNVDEIPVLTALTDEQVSDYLRQNPDFWVDKPSLLADINLPHHTHGESVSLIERQVSVLRDRNIDMRHRLNKLLDNARNNDHLFELSQRLILNMLETSQYDDCLDALFYSFQNDFGIEFSQLILMNPPGESFPEPANQQARIVERQLAVDSLSSLINHQRAVCGQLDPSERAFIFPQHAAEIGSTAVVPLRLNNCFLGLLAIGNRNEKYYRFSTNTLFLNFIADVMSRLLAEYLVEG